MGGGKKNKKNISNLTVYCGNIYHRPYEDDLFLPVNFSNEIVTRDELLELHCHLTPLNSKDNFSSSKTIFYLQCNEMAYRQRTVPVEVTNGSSKDYLLATESIWLLTFSSLQL